MIIKNVKHSNWTGDMTENFTATKDGEFKFQGHWFNVTPTEFGFTMTMDNEVVEFWNDDVDSHITTHFIDNMVWNTETKTHDTAEITMEQAIRSAVVWIANHV